MVLVMACNIMLLWVMTKTEQCMYMIDFVIANIPLCNLESIKCSRMNLDAIYKCLTKQLKEKLTVAQRSMERLCLNISGMR